MTRFILVFVLSFSAALALAYYWGAALAPVIAEVLGAFVVLAITTGTMSYALYAHVDGISKDVAAEKENLPFEPYSNALGKLENLKREVLVNAVLILALLLFERLLLGITNRFHSDNGEPFSWTWAALISLRVACFLTSMTAAAIQFQGFIIANRFRSVISGK
jgi:hypothetical protein